MVLVLIDNKRKVVSVYEGRNELGRAVFDDPKEVTPEAVNGFRTEVCRDFVMDKQNGAA